MSRSRAALLHALCEGGTVLIDGRSGSGKSTLADALIADAAVRGVRAQLVRLDDLYPGWEGLREGSLAVAQALATRMYRRYDWHAGAFAEAHLLVAGLPLVIEGCGAITRANLAAAAARGAAPAVGPEAPEMVGTSKAPDVVGAAAPVRSVWLECPTLERRERALGRDGAMYAPHWDGWAAQENAHYVDHQPWALADEVWPSAGEVSEIPESPESPESPEIEG